ncbi:histone-lysine N-methyltransferase PRDM7-like isoform X1 [Dermacentor andersoni]|uniref:histone-lysine N-methyltransferase PRDM7-like isoform X1 n=1 Tax=Dermacentor andersoni TaxID=34620 RepID=UPI0021556651|nr:histone-lysine N-methyltransferase PRDM9-like isoform X1 [Dermacentor andersoni]
MEGNSSAEGARAYFTEREWAKLPEYSKVRYGNIKQNYDKMVELGLQPPVPEFLNGKPAARKVPAKSKASGSSGHKAKRTTCDSQPESPIPKTGPVRCATRTQATKNASVQDDAQTGGSSNPRYSKRNRKDVQYTESEEASGDESPPSIAGTSSKTPQPTRRLPVKRSESEAAGNKQYKCRDGCSRDQPSQCPVHGPSFCVKGVPIKDFERATKSLPEGLAVLRSKIWGAQLGIFTVVPLAAGHCFGPYAHSSGKDSEDNEAMDQELCERETPQPDENSPRVARWIRYVNCAPIESRRNLVVLEKAGYLYYQTCQPLEPAEELLLWCGAPPPIREFGQGLQDAVRSWRAAFNCVTCGYSCSSKWQLDRHRETTHPSTEYDEMDDQSGKSEKSFSCDVCCKGFTTRVGLDRHIVTHVTRKPFKCEECTERFTQAVCLTRHRKIHTGELMYKCFECGRQFSMVSHFKSHVLSHSASKSYFCRVCKRAFTRKCHCIRHELTMHGKR